MVEELDVGAEHTSLLQLLPVGRDLLAAWLKYLERWPVWLQVLEPNVQPQAICLQVPSDQVCFTFLGLGGGLGKSGSPGRLGLGLHCLTFDELRSDQALQQLVSVSVLASVKEGFLGFEEGVSDGEDLPAHTCAQTQALLCTHRHFVLIRWKGGLSVVLLGLLLAFPIGPQCGSQVARLCMLPGE